MCLVLGTGPVYQSAQVVDEGLGVGFVNDLVVRDGLVRVGIAGRGVLLLLLFLVLGGRRWLGGVEDGGGARVDAGGGVDGAGVLLGEGEGVAGALEAGAGHDELGAADLAGAVDDGAEIIVVALLAVVDAPEDGIGQVDADLYTWYKVRPQISEDLDGRGTTTYINVSGLVQSLRWIVGGAHPSGVGKYNCWDKAGGSRSSSM